MNVGLPGVQSNTRSTKQYSTSIDGLDIVTTPPSPKTVLGDSVWGSRCWTFQELAFSKRCLFFTSSQVFFQCKIDTWCENTDWEYRDARVVRHSYLYENIDEYLNMYDVFSDSEFNGPSKYFPKYAKLVENYSSRVFSHESDYLDAFMGIEGLMKSQFGTNLLWGLPVNMSEGVVGTSAWKGDSSKNSISYRSNRGRQTRSFIPELILDGLGWPSCISPTFTVHGAGRRSDSYLDVHRF
jgi:hypothetical protein